MLDYLEDQYGNRITPSWYSGSTYPLLVHTVVQRVFDAGASHTRTLTFTYSEENTLSGGMNGGRLPSRVSDGTRVWDYGYESAAPHRLTEMAPPAGPHWAYSYSGTGTDITVTVTTLTGGYGRLHR